MRIDAPKRHDGVCDASGASFLADGSTCFLVANDEDQQQTILRLYEAEADGPPRKEFHLSNAVLDPDPDEPEIDLEASAWLGDRIFWIGSHSRSKKGKSRPSRHRLFATRMDSEGLHIEGRPYGDLVRDAAARLDFDLDPKAPPKDGGLSIEGLAASPNPGELLIGLRSPLHKKCAVVLPLRNAAAVVDKGAKASFGEAVLLDLDGLGIRSMDWWPERKCFLLLAGPAGGKASQFELMRWSGPLSSRPEVLDGIDFTALGVDEGASPEGLLIHGPSDTVYVIFDEGNRLVNGTPCKDAERRSFRTVAIHGL